MEEKRIKLAPHVVVEARAGTGKTTTCCGAVEQILGIAPKFTPSQQQTDIWNLIGQEKPNNIGVCAFSKIIQTELERRLPYDTVEVRTCHSFGCKILWNDNRTKYSKHNDYKTSGIIQKLTGMTPVDLKKKMKVSLYGACDLVQFAKYNLIDPFSEDRLLHAEMFQLFADNGIDMMGCDPDKTIEVAIQAFRKSCTTEPNQRGYEHIPERDFADMIWLPIVLDIEPTTKYDLLIVDESQDLNRCQQELVCRLGRRLVLVGDPKQAIFAFAGADCQSMPRMTERLKDTKRGVVTLPLNTTYRCGKKIVQAAQRFVPDYQAYEKNPDGEIFSGLPEEHLVRHLNDGDMVLCRINAPLVSLCFSLLSCDKKAYIQGRDIGAGLVKMIEKSKTQTVDEFDLWLHDWYQTERERLLRKKVKSETALMNLSDKCRMMRVFTEKVRLDAQNQDRTPTISALISLITNLFSDDKAGIRLSSIHRAKGLEADNVYIIRPEKLPHPMAKTPQAREQEDNLHYVAITRAIKKLTYCRTPDKEEDEFDE